MNYVSKQFDIDKLKQGFFYNIKEGINKFCETEDNKDVYALVFDCDNSIGQIAIRYANLSLYNELLKDYDKYAYMFEPYGKLGLRGYKYDVGDFEFIDYEFNDYISRFFNVYYYVMTGEQTYSDDKEIDMEVTDKIRQDYTNFFEELILDCIERLKKNNIINKTEDFIIYFCYHDSTQEEDEEHIRKTVDSELFNKLLNDSYVK